ncbi:CGI-121-domain-containing protein [Byssothecium circinans]|uniref:EKC/KEOPS complex subunit CGI121 n=1 Tax=Byssothecium circinans TaxID=147558 RepID=A0A6A5TS66_9PLEO|nr:CGI-121-domain-containing protein [Byssothecium circinans]
MAPTHTRTITLPHYPHHPLHITLFKNLKNASFLKSQLLSSNPSFDYAFLDATMILSPLPLYLSAALAIQAHLTNTLKTRTPHSELVFRLHPNNNIGEAYRKFGISETTTEMIAVKISLGEGVTRESVGRHLAEVVEGEAVEIGEESGELDMWADLGKIKKIYKLSDGGKGKKGAKGVVNGEGKDERREMESVIMGIMTLKGT